MALLIALFQGSTAYAYKSYSERLCDSRATTRVESGEWGLLTINE